MGQSGGITITPTFKKSVKAEKHKKEQSSTKSVMLLKEVYQVCDGFILSN